MRCPIIYILTDLELFHRLQKGDQQALYKLFDRHYISLCKYLYSYIPNRFECEEVAADAFEKIWQKRQQIQPENLKAYLFTIGRRMATKKKGLKYNAFMQIDTDGMSYQNPDMPIYVKEMEEILHNTLKKVSPKAKEIFELSRVGGLTYIEISEVMNISIKTVEKKMSEVLAQLRKSLNY